MNVMMIIRIACLGECVAVRRAEDCVQSSLEREKRNNNIKIWTFRRTPGGDMSTEHTADQFLTHQKAKKGRLACIPLNRIKRKNARTQLKNIYLFHLFF